ncbi:MAG: Amuc_1100 family pilus-like protein [Verrucomicrobiales bacterium]|nr:Amuc_1100 family pilus-like protein [Verrucomicrobiota bacterium JB025]
MSWIKDNKFLVGLLGGTLVGVILLYVVGSKGAKRYESARENYENAVAEAKGYEKSPLYPTSANRDGKKKALDDYRKAAESLQAAFAPYRPGKLNNVSSQEFTDNLKKVNGEVTAAFEAAGTTIPEQFFSGFENYKTTLARRDSTGILTYQLEGIRKVLLNLAKAKPSELKNLHRPELPEEKGGKFNPGGNEVARKLPLEIAFEGSEESARKFISSVVALDEQFVVIRNLRVRSSKQDPPKSSDVRFDSPAAATKKKEAASKASDIFGGAFADFDDGDAGEDGGADEAPAPEPEPAPTTDSSRILAQVLGGEDVQVFVRLDLMLFLPEKKLP